MICTNLSSVIQLLLENMTDAQFNNYSSTNNSEAFVQFDSPDSRGYGYGYGHGYPDRDYYPESYGKGPVNKYGKEPCNKGKCREPVKAPKMDNLWCKLPSLYSKEGCPDCWGCLALLYSIVAAIVGIIVVAIGAYIFNSPYPQKVIPNALSYFGFWVVAAILVVIGLISLINIRDYYLDIKKDPKGACERARFVNGAIFLTLILVILHILWLYLYIATPVTTGLLLVSLLLLIVAFITVLYYASISLIPAVYLVVPLIYIIILAIGSFEIINPYY